MEALAAEDDIMLEEISERNSRRKKSVGPYWPRQFMSSRAIYRTLAVDSPLGALGLLAAVSKGTGMTRIEWS